MTPIDPLVPAGEGAALDLAALDSALDVGGGILRLEPAWVARSFLPPGRRLELERVAGTWAAAGTGEGDDPYDVGERGFICERWLASVTIADNRVGPPNEGLSRIALGEPGDGRTVLLRDAVAAARSILLGAPAGVTTPREGEASPSPGPSAVAVAGLGRLAKIFDYGERLPFHVHPQARWSALVGRNPKDEAYHFPDRPLGAHPETFLGLHPSLAEPEGAERLLRHLVDWRDDGILAEARGFVQRPGDGFLVPSGLLHAPGTALTIELQEDSDVFAMLQARVGAYPIDKELLFKDVRREDRERDGERFVLNFVDMAANVDPLLYEHARAPARVRWTDDAGASDDWVFYGTAKFSGLRLRIPPGGAVRIADPAAFSIYVVEGEGRVGAHPVSAVPGLDELFVTAGAAGAGVTYEARGDRPLELIRFFGPGDRSEAPALPGRG